MTFEKLVLNAKAGDERSLEELFFMYRPLIIKRSMVNGIFSEDMYQELSKAFIVCIKKFDIQKVLRKSDCD